MTVNEILALLRNEFNQSQKQVVCPVFEIG